MDEREIHPASDELGEITYFHYDPVALDLPPAGVQSGWLVIWDGTGDATIVPVANLIDGDGGGTIVQTGPPQPGRVVDDRED